jgi:transcriptional regulator with XRE-family HTH domain
LFDMFSVPAEVLKYVREQGGVSQAKLAQTLGTVASVVSKMEKGEDAEPELAERYLKAVGSDLAASVKEFYGRDWRHSEPPSFLHPDREVLWQVDEALTGLKAFEKSPKNHPILKGPIELLRTELSGNALYLRRRDHTIAWVGDIGVGKTTALAHAAGLLIGDGRSQRRPAFPVGSGRTTVCETAIRVASTYGIAVDAIDDDEVVRMTRDMVTSLTAKASGVGVPSEISRVLRNMSGTKVQTVQTGDDEYDSIDPIAQLLDSGLSIDETVDRVVAAMNLAGRKEQQLVLPEGLADGLNWLSKLIHNINSGLDERFGVPKRITVLMPYDNLTADGQILSVIDTRGVEAITQRRDLDDHRDDQRTLVVLCSKFADAPSPTTQKFLQDLLEAGSDAAERRRVCILVLPRDDEALQLPGLDEPLRSRAEGYAVRKRDVAQAFVKAKLPATPVYFFDALKDDPDKIWASLRGQVADMRRAYADRIIAASDGVKDLIRNVDIVKTGEARRNIEAASDRLAKAIRELPATRRAAYLNLIDKMTSGHHSSIAAAMVRGGDWYNFPVFNILGAGVRMDANLRTADHLSRVEHKFEELEVEYKALKDVRQSLVALRALVAEGRQEFLAAAQTIGRDAYGSLLSREQDLWERCEDRYGRGSGYKQDIAKAFQTYFETAPAPAETAAAVDKRLQKAWEQFVILPFVTATRADASVTEPT